MSFEDLLKDKAAKLHELELATELIRHKEARMEQLTAAMSEIAIVKDEINSAREDLETLKAQTLKCRELSTMLDKLNMKILQLDQRLPTEFMEEFHRMIQVQTPCSAKSVKKVIHNEINKETDENEALGQLGGLRIDTPEPPMEDCKKTLFQNAEDSYSMDLLTEEEFSKIPRYIINRQPLSALNNLVTVINQILESKYEILAMGKNLARKKGKLDLYLSLKRDEIVVEPGKDPIYFFTAEDYFRHTQTKLDKQKLNLLTALRHCKRLRELRTGKTLQYVVIPSWERCRG